jgi:hypothetical protein
MLVIGFRPFILIHTPNLSMHVSLLPTA